MPATEALVGKMTEHVIKKVAENAEKKLGELKEFKSADSESLHKKLGEITSQRAVQLEEYATSMLEQAKQRQLEEAKQGTQQKDKISFGSLANGTFKADERYLKWKDGVDVGEITPDYMKELANEIAAIYGKDIIKVKEAPGYENAGIIPKQGKILYDPEYLRQGGNEYGTDKILGSLSHEIGHRVVYNLGLQKEISDYENEACADYIAGLTARLCKLNKDHQLSWYNDRSEISADGVHPGKSVRMEAFNRGYERIDRGKEAIALRTFEVFSPYDLEGTYQNAHMLKSILYQDVIAPLRTGEIKKV